MIDLLIDLSPRLKVYWYSTIYYFPPLWLCLMVNVACFPLYMGSSLYNLFTYYSNSPFVSINIRDYLPSISNTLYFFLSMLSYNIYTEIISYAIWMTFKFWYNSLSWILKNLVIQYILMYLKLSGGLIIMVCFGKWS